MQLVPAAVRMRVASIYTASGILTGMLGRSRASSASAEARVISGDVSVTIRWKGPLTILPLPAAVASIGRDPFPGRSDWGLPSEPWVAEGRSRRDRPILQRNRRSLVAVVRA